jgi:hypothetical protein
MEIVHERCAGLDVHKATVVACVLTSKGRETRTFGTMQPSDCVDERLERCQPGREPEFRRARGTGDRPLAARRFRHLAFSPRTSPQAAVMDIASRLLFRGRVGFENHV